MTPDDGYVRRCLTPSCGGRLFATSDRACRQCGRPRPKSCAAVLVLGGSPFDHIRIRDLLDADFNSLSFVGRIAGRVSQVHPGLWRIDDADLLMPPSYASKVIPCDILIASALRRGGLKVAEPEPAELPAPAAPED